MFSGWKPLTNICDPLLDPGTAGSCGIGALLELIQNGITDLVIVSTLIVVAAAFFSGFKLVTAGMRGDSGALNDAKKMFGKIATGYAVILLAWVVVYTLVSTFLKPGFFYFLEK